MNSNNKKLIVAAFAVVALALLAGSGPLKTLHNRQLAATKAATSRDRESGQSNIAIRGNGEVELLGVRVDSNDGGQMAASGTLGDESITVVIQTDRKTKVSAGKKRLEAREITEGTLLFVTGRLKDFSPLTIMAEEIRAPGLLPADGEVVALNPRELPALPSRVLTVAAAAETPSPNPPSPAEPETEDSSVSTTTATTTVPAATSTDTLIPVPEDGPASSTASSSPAEPELESEVPTSTEPVASAATTTEDLSGGPATGTESEIEGN